MIEYVKMDSVKPGDKLLRTIFDEKGRTLLRYGCTLSEKQIEVLKSYHFKGMYIENNTGERRNDIPISEPLIDDIFAIQIAGRIKDFCDCHQRGFELYDPVFSEFKKRMDDIIDDIVHALYTAKEEKRLLYETEDLRSKKTWLYYHSINTCVISAGIAIKMGLPLSEVKNIARAGMYHDIGKVFINHALVTKDSITKEEKEELRTHAEKGFRVFQKQNYPIAVTYGIWFHHEREDGTGYPNKVKAEKIPVSAKIVGLASHYDNLVNYNPIEETILDSNDAIEKIMADTRFNTDVVRAFTEFVMPYNIGFKVKLSDGRIATVVKNREGFPLRPYLLSQGQFIDMNAAANLNIVISEAL